MKDELNLIVQLGIRVLAVHNRFPTRTADRIRSLELQRE